MPRPSRRDQLLETALDLFTRRGYEGTAISDIAEATQMTKAAISYHFSTKEDLLLALAEPLIAALEAVPGRHPAIPDWPNGLAAMLTDYFDVLIEHRDVVEWLDGDKAVLRHETIGPRLRANNRAMRQAISGGVTQSRAEFASSAALGMFWRPLRNIKSHDPAEQRDTIVGLVMAASESLRG